MLRLLVWDVSAHLLSVFLHPIDTGNTTITFSVSNLHITAAATKVNVFLRPISFATSTPGITESHTHLLTMNLTVQIWCGRNLIRGRLAIEYFVPGTQTFIDSWIRHAFSNLTTLWSYSCSNLYSILKRSFPNTNLLRHGSSTSLWFTRSWTFLERCFVIYSSPIISFCCPNWSWANGLIL